MRLQRIRQARQLRRFWDWPLLWLQGDDKIVEQSGDCSKCIEKEKDAQRAQNLDPFGTVARQKARDEEKARNEKK